MESSRREFLKAGIGAAVAATLAGCADDGSDERAAAAASVAAAIPETGDRWGAVRAMFALDPKLVHMSAMYIASHPKPVRDAIDEYRRGLDADPLGYLNRHNRRRTNDTRLAAARYLGANDAADVALTESTTAGIGLVYNGIRLAPGDDILTTEHDYFVTHESLALVSTRTGATVRRIALFDKSSEVSAAQIVDRIARAVLPQTRVVALTWVHSSTGLKLPIRAIADAIGHINEGRDDDQRALLCVDGVHGFGVEASDVADLGCDFLMAGCHKWLFGPRGTGIIWGSSRAWRRSMPTIPSFLDDESWDLEVIDEKADAGTTGRGASPGGFKAFEHTWALARAFDLHLALGKEAIAERTHALNRQLREGIAGIGGITLHTPRADDLSAGIVCFDVDGMAPRAVVRRLRERGIVASVTPYAIEHARLSPCVYNTPAEIDAVLDVLREMG